MPVGIYRLGYRRQLIVWKLFPMRSQFGEKSLEHLYPTMNRCKANKLPRSGPMSPVSHPNGRMLITPCYQENQIQCGGQLIAPALGHLRSWNRLFRFIHFHWHQESWPKIHGSWEPALLHFVETVNVLDRISIFIIKKTNNNSCISVSSP